MSGLLVAMSTCAVPMPAQVPMVRVCSVLRHEPGCWGHAQARAALCAQQIPRAQVYSSSDAGHVPVKGQEAWISQLRSLYGCLCG